MYKLSFIAPPPLGSFSKKYFFLRYYVISTLYQCIKLNFADTRCNISNCHVQTISNLAFIALPLTRTNQREKHSVSFIGNKTYFGLYNSTLFKLTDLFILFFFIQNVYADKKIFQKKRL